ncbi:ATP-binding protein [Chitinophaga sp. HK235]|uniref:hybrid sensor histidine kinase/response regulator n=1 Tax=Chitinophaga sp. HK235 TaxID=2952571 RepID=UPI001BA8F82F|nr:ATP-binding protein [Chitinophaga sp. HK235]
MFQALLRSIKSLTQAGTTGLSEEDSKNVRIINTVSLFTAILAISISALLYYHTRLLGILIPAQLEGISFLILVWLNKKGVYRLARLGVLFIFCVTALYFDIILGQNINLALICVFLFCLTLLVYNDPKERLMGIFITVLTLFFMELNFYKSFFQPYQLSISNQFFLRWTALTCFLSFNAIVILYYVKDRKMWYDKLKSYSASLEDMVQQLKAANQAKRVYLRETNHEIRTPLNAIFGIGQLLETKLANYDGSTTSLCEIQELVTHLNSSSIFAKNIVNNVLELSRIESGIKENVHNVYFHTAIWIRELVQMHYYLARSQKVKLELIMDESSLPKKLFTDKIKLTQIVTNILSNAIKYSQEDGKVTIQLYQEDNDFFIVIEDQGKGISPEQQVTIFEPFVTAGNGFIEGTGLGLYISRQLALMLNGNLELRSEEGKGSVFTISLNNIQTDASPDKSTQPTEVLCDLNRKRVLVIDDDSMSRMILSKYLREAGCELYEAADGKDGLSKARSERPDFIVLDTQMPIMDGRETLKNIRRDRNISHIPVIITSADSFMESRNEMMAAGASEFIPKPIEFRALHQVLSRIIQ